jgi:hypothetical protein
MLDENKKIERLLERNTDEQLADFDWEQLRAAISRRVSQVEKQKASKRKYPIVFKVAAGVAAAAAVVIVALTVQMKDAADIPLRDGGTARVELAGNRGSASVQIIEPVNDVEPRSTQAAWIIISRPEPVYADNGFSKDIKDTICLF